MSNNNDDGCATGCGCLVILVILFLIFKNINLVIWGGVIFFALIIIGAIKEKIDNRNRDYSYNDESGPNSNESNLILELVFKLGGYVARGNGVIDKTQIDAVSSFIDNITSNPDARKFCIKAFNEGKAQDYDPRESADLIRKLLVRTTDLRDEVMHFLLSIVFADGVMTNNEYARLKIVSEILGISESLLNTFVARQKAEQSFNQNNYSNSYDDSDDEGYDDSNSYYEEPENDKVSDAYKILELPENSTFRDVRRQYHRLMNRYHPDHLRHEGLSEEMIRVSTAKAQKIQAAYELLEKMEKNK